jgi:hypothetical protein
MYLGDYIAIDQQVGPYSFICSCVSTGTEFKAEVDADKRKWFDDMTFPDQNHSACRFLRPLGHGRIGCTIHKDSPAQCKYYRCVIIRILDSSGTEIGTVTGTHALHSEDHLLRTLWDEKISVFISGDSQDIEVLIFQELQRAGYKVA